MATAEYGGDQLHLTEGLQHRREYECSNPTSQTLGTLYDMPRKNRLSMGGSGKMKVIFIERRILGGYE